MPETKVSPHDPVTAALTLLREMHDFTHDGKNPRPLLLRGNAKCVVGKAWCTFYRVVGDKSISDPKSVRTGHLDEVRKESVLHGGREGS